jgi:hypothetical protein
MQIVLSLKQRHEGLSVAARIYRTAKERLLEIWDYTERTWGEEQADHQTHVQPAPQARESSGMGRPSFTIAVGRPFRSLIITLA